MSDATTVIETVAGLFERKNLTLNDPPLMSINCTSNCGELQNIKGNLLSNQIATRNTNEKKTGQVELVRKLAANNRVTNFRVLFGAYRVRVQGP